MSWKWLIATVVISFVAVACTADSTPRTVDEYAAAMQAVESEFQAEAPDPSGQPEDRNRYPLGGDLVVANELYMYLESRLAGWRAITPPPSISPLHDRLVYALDAIQHEVGKYLGEQAMTESDFDFDFDTIGPAVAPFLREATAACRALQSALHDTRTDVDFVDNCNF